MSEEDDGFSYAADEPTAMWDEDSLKGLGLEAPQGSAASPAATKGSGAAGPSVQVSLGPASGGARGFGLSWGITIALALGLGAGVYFLIRFLR